MERITLLAMALVVWAVPGIRAQEPNPDIPPHDGLRADRVTFSPVIEVDPILWTGFRHS